MTGFQPDIEHVYRILQKYSDQNQYVFYGNDANSLGSKKVVEKLSHTLRHVAQFQTNRPYGIQILIDWQWRHYSIYSKSQWWLASLDQ